MQIKPIIVEGDTIRNVTGKNANFMMENGIGIGSRIIVVKSGVVIPEIVSVIQKAKITFPKVKFHWDENHFNIILKKNL